MLVYSSYKSAYDNQRYDDALALLPVLLEKSPGATQNIYVYAINIYKIKIQRSRDIRERSGYVDSLFGLYDLRMEHFGDRARYGRPHILRQRAKDHLLLRPADREGIRVALHEAMEANASDLDLANTYFKELTDDFAVHGIISAGYYLEEYKRLSAIISNSSDPAKDEAGRTLDSVFASAGAGNCGGMEKIFGERIAASPEDVARYAEAFDFMYGQKCVSEFFFRVGEKYFKARPSSATARIMAGAYKSQGNGVKALEYLLAAADVESDPVVKAEICTEISDAECAGGNYRSAAGFAERARGYDPGNGYACLALARAYVSGCGCGDVFDAQTVYWLAYDLAQSARGAFAGNTDELRRTSALMASYRSEFPPKEEIFFRGLSEGALFEVKCGWITGTATVREGDR